MGSEMCIRDSARVGFPLGAITDGVVTFRSVTATSGSVDLPEVILGASSIEVDGAAVSSGAINNIVIRIAALLAVTDELGI